MYNSGKYNKAQSFPKNGNNTNIGLDKLVLELPAEISLDKLGTYNEKTTIDNSTGEVIKSYGNLNIGTNVKISQAYGSNRISLNPAKEVLGSNFYTLPRQELRKYLKDFQEQAGIGISKCILRRLDPQAILKTNYKPVYYFKVLGAHQTLQRNLKGKSSLYFNSTSSNEAEKYKTLLLYDKGLKEGKNTPIEFLNGYYLRYEAQYYNKFLKTIAKKFNKKHLLVEDLFNDAIYNELINWWYKDYQAIHKNKQLAFNIDNVQKPSDIDKILACQGIERLGGIDAVKNMIDASNITQEKEASFISKTKGRVKELVSNGLVVAETPLLEELESKINEAYCCAISSTTA